MVAKRNYAREAKWENSPEQVKNREARNRARAQMIKAGVVKKGDGLDVDHRTPLAKGGGTGKSNLRAVPKSQNRSFARTKNAGMK
jgi:hypothetical protein